MNENNMEAEGSFAFPQVKTEPKEEGEEEDDDELVPKRGNRSSTVWLWFGFKTSDIDQKTVICKTCRRQIATSDSNTSNLFYHLKTRHEALYLESLRMRESVIGAPQPQSNGLKKVPKARKETLGKYDEQSRRHREITEAICEFLVSEERASLDTVRKKGFRELIKTLEPRYNLPDPKHFTDVQLPRMYEECRSKVTEELKSVEYYALTCRVITPPYVSLTVHFINHDWILRSRCLQTSYFPEDRTVAGMSSVVKEVLESWDLREDMLVCVTADNATRDDHEWNRLQCFGRHLQMAIENSLKTSSQSQAAVSDAVGMCKQVTAAISNSLKRRRDLAKAQVDLDVPIHQLKTENPTRWGSRQQMISRFIQQEKAVKQVLLEDRKVRHLTPTRQDMRILESVNTALSPLKEFTDAFSGEEYVSVSYVKPVLHLFKNQILKPHHDDSALTRSVKEGILRYLCDEYADDATERLLDTATLLDPRFKTAYIKEERIEWIKSRAAAEMELLMAGVRPPAPEVFAAAAPSDESDLPAAKKAKRSLSSYFKKAASPASGPGGGGSKPSRASVELELNTYLRTAELDPEKDPLEWWRQHELNFPWVAKLAKKYLCVPATSFPSEQIFGAGGDAGTWTGCCGKPQRIDQMVFLSANLRKAFN
ncbi:E3 SUMO-protein ligase ZBED1-like [Corythoichthys intestinalis]|uniref:E3 SUMO-protein ligase ZBED1-like n=1 Tax=Corythoichthys intestinalis TaxID=161448 RepID=UPI0025A4CF38|nr:E3 SUMO-protein ligase ZBED1-like [Corythoichthys intestinalis]XP_061794914.1 E3 SUMO-protein ligase ZBED1-like [Nerophis lumbriciformis]